MNKKMMMIGAVALIASACSNEMEISSSDVPPPVLTAFESKYTGATDVEWEVEKEDGRLYFEADFKFEGKENEVHIRPDGTFADEE